MMSLEKIDTSYWLAKDKNWMEDRAAQWPAIEKVVASSRNKAEVNVIKQYFMRGKMPKWEKYRNWERHSRHVDLRFFLWLHPSCDLEVLKPLFRCYIESDLIHPQDVMLGLGSFVDNEFLSATSPYKSMADYPFPFLGSKNIILFRVMFGDVDYARDKVCGLVGVQENHDEKIKNIFGFLGYHHFLFVRSWLLQDAMSPLMLNCLYQYDEVIKWCISTMVIDKEGEFVNEVKSPAGVKEYRKSLYCIFNFDTEKEGDTCRTRALKKIRKILDEHDFVPEFKKMWEDVKAGKIEVKDPWKV